MSSPLERSSALWNCNRLDLRSEETLAQILDRGSLDDWRTLYRLAEDDAQLRARLRRVVQRVPLGYPHFWRTALRSLGEPVDLDAQVPEDGRRDPGSHLRLASGAGEGRSKGSGWARPLREIFPRFSRSKVHRGHLHIGAGNFDL